jgi:hypothetical protein
MVDSVASRNNGRFLSTSMRLRDAKILITAHGDASTVTILQKKSTEGGAKTNNGPPHAFTQALTLGAISAKSLCQLSFILRIKSRFGSMTMIAVIRSNKTRKTFL